MGRIVCVHGIEQQLAGEQSLLRDWIPALLDGLTRAGHDGAVTADDVVMGFYGDLFRPAGELLAVGDPMFTADDVEPGLEEDLLLAWWQEAARVDAKVAPPEADTLVRAPGSVQAALRQLSRSQQPAGQHVEPELFLDLPARTGPGRLALVQAATGDLPGFGAVGGLDEQDTALGVAEDHAGAGDLLGQRRVVLGGRQPGLGHARRRYPPPPSPPTTGVGLQAGLNFGQQVGGHFVHPPAPLAAQPDVQGARAAADPANRAGRIAQDQGVRGRLAQDDGADADHGVGPDLDARCDTGTGADGRAAAHDDRRRRPVAGALSLPVRAGGSWRTVFGEHDLRADHDLVVELRAEAVGVIADLDIVADPRTGADVAAFAQRAAGIDFDVGELDARARRRAWELDGLKARLRLS